VRYDLRLIARLCDELGLTNRLEDDRIKIVLGPGDVLVFQNAERDADCLMAFEGSPWHVHDEIVFDDGNGRCVELDDLDVVAALADGRLLVCEAWRDDAVADKRLVHRDFNDEFKGMTERVELRVRRAVVTRPSIEPTT